VTGTVKNLLILILNYMKNLEKQLAQKYPLLGSSTNPEEVSMTVKGAVVALLPVLALVLGQFGVSQEWLSDLVNAVFGVVGSVILLWGVVRKFKK